MFFFFCCVFSHVLDELEHQINTKQKSDMSDRELQFHYFKLHDYDNNNLLDGLEIVKALKHSHEEGMINKCRQVLINLFGPWCC